MVRALRARGRGFRGLPAAAAAGLLSAAVAVAAGFPLRCWWRRSFQGSRVRIRPRVSTAAM